MEKEKLIEEMARVIDIDCGECYTCQYYESKGINCTCLLQAEELYNAGYRKQEDILHEWVERETAYLNEIAELKKKIDIFEESHYLTYERGKKESAKEVLEQFICDIVNAKLVHTNDDMYYELLELKDELLKKYGVEV